MRSFSCVGFLCELNSLRSMCGAEGGAEGGAGGGAGWGGAVLALCCARGAGRGGCALAAHLLHDILDNNQVPISYALHNQLQ